MSHPSQLNITLLEDIFDAFRQQLFFVVVAGV